MTMRVAKLSRSFLALALPAVLGACTFAQEHVNIQPNTIREQLANQGSGPAAPAPHTPAAPKPVPVSAPTKPATSPAVKVAAKPAAKMGAAAHAKPALKASAAAPSVKTAAVLKAPVAAVDADPFVKAAEDKTPFVRRDPFDTLLTKASNANGTPENLPPGKAGLLVDTLRIEGILSSSNGMIAIVSNPQQRVYFLHDGDKLYDGAVEKISIESVAFKQFGKDAFGKPLERVVTKRLYPSPGE
jgi:Tfp pilus assembly protein PilP